MNIVLMRVTSAFALKSGSSVNIGGEILLTHPPHRNISASIGNKRHLIIALSVVTVIKELTRESSTRWLPYGLCWLSCAKTRRSCVKSVLIQGLLLLYVVSVSTKPIAYHLITFYLLIFAGRLTLPLCSASLISFGHGS